MKKILPLIIIGLFVCVTLLNGVSATTTDENDTIRNHGPLYVGSKPFEEYEQPGFVCGFYDEIDWMPNANNCIRSLYSPHMLFGGTLAIGTPLFHYLGIFR